MGRGPSIEGRKNAEDAKRARIFTKLIRDITIAARAGADPAGNAKLRGAVDKALAANMPKDKIEKAIRRGSGADGGADLQEVRYEGYGPGGVALIIETLTDNPVRTVADVRHALSKNGGNLGTSGSVAFQFNRTGEILLSAEGITEEQVLEAALDAGAEDVFSDEGNIVVLCPTDGVDAVEQALRDAGLNVEQAGV
ncbi:MAG: YebC/PmpR family DNA-binding transcriptional regulator, partial [Xanthomonadales bacterium]|nr:YebC/PmpR family DNA-binding transcriptional regulator [Xanthomonadales bacterium]